MYESSTMEIEFVKNDIRDMLYELKDWMKPVKVLY